MVGRDGAREAGRRLSGVRRAGCMFVLAWGVGAPLGFHTLGTVLLVVAAALAVPFAVGELRHGWRVGRLRAARRRVPLVDLRLVGG